METQAQVVGMPITYNGVNINQWFIATDVQRGLGTNHSNQLTKIGKTDGQYFRYMTRDTLMISVTGYIRDDDDNTGITAARRSLAQALDTDDLEQLIFGDEPDKYYLAILDGQSSIAETGYNGTVTMNFIVPDGIAHSVATQTADNMPYKNLPENLYIDTQNFNNLASWYSSSSWTKTTDTYKGLAVVQTTQDWNGLSQYIQVKKGDVLTYSVYAKYVSGTGTSSIYWTLSSQTEGSYSIAAMNPVSNAVTITDSWQRVSGTTVATSDGYLRPRIERSINNTNTLQIAGIKVEKGSVASQWSPNPADPEYYADTITVQNDGTYPVYPVIEATMKSDNGVVAFASDSGAALQFGNPQEVDGYIADNSEKVLQIGYEKDPGIGVLNAGAISDYPNYNNNVSQPLKIQGTVDYADTRGNDPAGGSGIWPKYNNAKSDYWGGPTMYFPIHANSNKSKTGNFIMKTRFSFNTSVKQMGRLEIYLANGKTPEYGIVLRASTTINDLIICEFHAGGQYMDSFELNRNVFKNNRQKEVQITKLGSDITFSIGEVYQYIANDQVKTSGKVTKNYNLANMKDVPIDGYNLWFEEYSTIWPVQSDVTDTQFSWVNVDRWVDLPNRFDKGDVLTVDVQNRTIFLNGVENRTLQTIGNQWSDFLISPGLTKIEPVCSTWATMFDTKISLREAYV